MIIEIYKGVEIHKEISHYWFKTTKGNICKTLELAKKSIDKQL